MLVKLYLYQLARVTILSAVLVSSVYAFDKSTVTPFIQAIEKLKHQQGVYSSEAGEIMFQLGDEYQKNDRHQQAVDTYNLALQITKINQGLYHVSQLPIIDAMLTSLTELKRWKELDDKYFTMYWIGQRNFDRQSQAYHENLLRYANWLLNTYKSAFDDERPLRLKKAEVLFLRAINSIEDKHGALALEMVPALKGVVLTNYFKSLHTNPVATVTINNDITGAEIGLSEEMTASGVQMAGYLGGKRALNKILTIRKMSKDFPRGVSD